MKRKTEYYEYLENEETGGFDSKPVPLMERLMETSWGPWLVALGMLALMVLGGMVTD